MRPGTELRSLIRYRVKHRLFSLLHQSEDELTNLCSLIGRERVITTDSNLLCSFPDPELPQGPEKCTVKFVDYGNCCEVEKANLKLIPEEHLSMPANSLLVR